MAPAFDLSADFAEAKASNTPCSNLNADNGCAIHNDRQAMGFRGCIVFDCRGAGQRVTQSLFAGADWRTNDALRAQMSDTYRQVVRVHDMLALLDAARALDIPADRQDALTVMIEKGLTEPPPDAALFETEGHALLRTLKAFIAPT